jgi:RNA polymerase sigma-70 factor, ECF subfamily
LGTRIEVHDGRDDASTGVSRGRFNAVVAAAQRGDDKAVAELFTELQPGLLRFLRARSGQADDDLAGEVWLAVAQRIQHFEGDWDDFRKWFFTIARRRLADHHRTNHKRRTIVEGNAFEERSEATTRGSDEHALARLSGEQSATLVASVLSSEQAEVVLLRVFGDLDADQVGAIMRRSPGWVRVTQHRALRRLATHVDDGATVTSP